MISLAEYEALIAKVDDTANAVSTRRSDAITCHQGCESCCHTELTVSQVEAEAIRLGLSRLSADERDVIRTRAAVLANEASPRCVMLGDDGRCAVYASRPIVCRTQGHALRYPEGIIPEKAIFARTESGPITWCPLNYTQKAPEKGDVLDAERIDVMLALVNRRASDDPLSRTWIRAIAAER